VARLDVRAEPRFALPGAWATVVARAFSQRRKTLRNSLRGLIDTGGWESSGIDAAARPEQLRPEQFATLAAQVVMPINTPR
jgi:16S rRNA (adenine1518-N6/adenine1519-N6)-dimethyltransferase